LKEFAGTFDVLEDGIHNPLKKMDNLGVVSHRRPDSHKGYLCNLLRRGWNCFYRPN